MGQDLIVYEPMCGASVTHGVLKSASKCPVAIGKREKTLPNQLPGKIHFLTLVANDVHTDEEIRGDKGQYVSVQCPLKAEIHHYKLNDPM